MVEIRTWDGDVDELSAFLRSVWRAGAREHGPVPDWHPELLAWQFHSRTDREQRYQLAAYDGGRLVGSFFAIETRFQARGHPFEGSCASWLTVDPEARHNFVAPRLVSEMMRRHSARGAELITGFAVPGTAGGHRFWSLYAKAFPDHVTLLRPLPVWVRVLDGGRLAAANASAGLRMLARGLGVATGRPRPAGTPVAPLPAAVPAASLEACSDLLQSAGSNCDLAVSWDAQRLRHQLVPGNTSSYGPRTWITERDGRPSGWISVHDMDLYSRAAFPVRVIDHVVAAARADAPKMHRSLLRSALVDAVACDRAMAMLLRPPWLPRATLLSLGFAPLDLGLHVVCLRLTTPRPALELERVHLLLR